MNNNHFYKSSNLIFVYLGLFCKRPYDDYYGSRYQSDRFVFKIFRSYTLMLSLCNNLLLFRINFECQSNLLIGIIILLIHLNDTAMKDMIEESKWKNVRIFTDAFIHWLQSNSNIFEKNSNYRCSERESRESRRRDATYREKRLVTSDSFPIM